MKHPQLGACINKKHVICITSFLDVQMKMKSYSTCRFLWNFPEQKSENWIKPVFFFFQTVGVLLSFCHSINLKILSMAIHFLLFFRNKMSAYEWWTHNHTWKTVIVQIQVKPAGWVFVCATEATIFEKSIVKFHIFFEQSKTFCSISYQQNFPHKYLKYFFCNTSLLIFCLDRLISTFNQIHLLSNISRTEPKCFSPWAWEKKHYGGKCPKILNQLSLNQ